MKIFYLTVFVELAKKDSFKNPLHLYAYRRVMNKSTGLIELATPPRWENSFVEVGAPEYDGLEMDWIDPYEPVGFDHVCTKIYCMPSV